MINKINFIIIPIYSQRLSILRNTTLYAFTKEMNKTFSDLDLNHSKIWSRYLSDLEYFTNTKSARWLNPDLQKSLPIYWLLSINS